MIPLMETCNVREINEAVRKEASNGTRLVRWGNHIRVYGARIRAGKLQIRTWDNTWSDITGTVTIYS